MNTRCYTHTHTEQEHTHTHRYRGREGKLGREMAVRIVNIGIFLPFFVLSVNLRASAMTMYKGSQ